jgi:hypothetical protein
MEKSEFTIDKTTVECYKIRHRSGMYWADINVDSMGTKGRISIASDFGKYSYFWGACGCSFKEFLMDLPMEYAADKFDADRWFDLEATISSYKRNVLESRRSEDIDAELARSIYDEIKDLQQCSNENEFTGMMWNQHCLMQYYDNCPELYRTMTPLFRRFWENVWPVFIDQLKSEKL